MIYSRKDIEVIDVGKHLVEKQEMYFGSRGANPESICTSIAEGALILGANETNIKEKDGWWFVSADLDWLNVSSEVQVNETTAFDTIHAFPEGGVNWFRSEVMAKVFSDCCFTNSSGEPVLITGKLPNANKVAELCSYTGGWARTIAFKFKKKV